jgi:putative spermidine/putrescine transport system permease protein
MTLRTRTAWLLLLPAGVLLLVFFVVPILDILARSVTEPKLGLATYRELLADETTVRVLTRTMVMALGAVVICLVMGYPYAYLMTLVGPTGRTLLMVLVLVPFWTSLMARTFAWISLLQRDGPVASLLAFFGMADVTLLNSAAGVMIGMVQILLPYMVLTLATALRSIDRGLLTAAQSLGANRYRAFWQVYFPLSIPGILAGSALVFILAIGFYITPQLLGSPRESLMAQVIGVRVEKLVDFAGAGGLSAILLLATLALVLVGAFAARPVQRVLGATGGEHERA